MMVVAPTIPGFPQNTPTGTGPRISGKSISNKSFPEKADTALISSQQYLQKKWVTASNKRVVTHLFVPGKIVIR